MCAALVISTLACGAASPSPATVPTVTNTTNASSPDAAPQDLPVRVAYGADPLQFGDLYRPGTAAGPTPVVVLVHGGFWRNQFGLDLMDPLAVDLVARGFAVWNIEYRRVGDEGGGWPGTLTDVAAAVDHLAVIADDHSLAIDRVAIVGHSAGGHLALWAAGRGALPPDATGAGPIVVPTVAVGQGPVVGLEAAASAGLGGGAVVDFLGGDPATVPDRYEIATPSLGAGPVMIAVVGSADDVVPAAFSVDAAQPGAIEVVTVDGADHFDLIDPAHPAWAAVVARLPE